MGYNPTGDPGFHPPQRAALRSGIGNLTQDQKFHIRPGLAESRHEASSRAPTQNFKRLRKARHTHHPLDDATGNAEALLALKEQSRLQPHCFAADQLGAHCDNEPLGGCDPRPLCQRDNRDESHPGAVHSFTDRGGPGSAVQRGVPAPPRPRSEAGRVVGCPEQAGGTRNERAGPAKSQRSERIPNPLAGRRVPPERAGCRERLRHRHLP